MRIRLVAAGAERSYDTGLGRFTEAEAIPCFRCGVCCLRWTPLVDHQEAQRLAAFLGMVTEQFLAEHARPYPLEADAAILRQNDSDGGCIFLRWENGLAACAVHPARPQACRDWDASLLRKECLDGLKVSATAYGELVELPFYDDPVDAEAFYRRLRG